MTDQHTEKEASTVALTLRLSEAQHERLRNAAHVLRRPISELIREAIDKTHFHAADVWCEECPPAYRVPPMDGSQAPSALRVVDGATDPCTAPGYRLHTAVGAGAISSPYRCHGCGSWFTLPEEADRG